MSVPQTLILVLYFFVLSILAIYGWHRYYLVYLYMKNRGRAPEPLPAPDPEDLPRSFQEMQQNVQTGIPIVRVAKQMPESVKRLL